MTTDRQQKIERRAYEIWERHGRPHGREQEHWQEAEAEIAREEAAAKPAKPEKAAAPKAKPVKATTPSTATPSKTTGAAPCPQPPPS